MAAPNICTFNKYGYCKYKEVCRKQHINEKCVDSSCDIRRCSLRYPRVCKFYKFYKMCKFDHCAFLHVDSDDDYENLKIKTDNLEKKLSDMDDKLKNALKTKTRDDDMSTIEKQINEKDMQIENLQKKLDILEIKINKLSENKMEKKKVKSIKCSYCDFVTNSQQGLRIHISKMHTSVEKDNLNTCEFCEKKFENENDLKYHLKEHSYKRANYRCTECDFVGRQPITMEIHLGKYHSDKFECGLCDSETKDFETLQTHLFTCEIYMCQSCKKRFKGLSDIKKHIQEEHEKSKIYHIKMDRIDENEISDTLFSIEDI